MKIDNVHSFAKWEEGRRHMVAPITLQVTMSYLGTQLRMSA